MSHSAADRVRRWESPTNARQYALRAVLALIELRTGEAPTPAHVRAAGRASCAMCAEDSHIATDDVEWIADHALDIADAICPDPREVRS